MYENSIGARIGACIGARISSAAWILEEWIASPVVNLHRAVDCLGRNEQMVRPMPTKLVKQIVREAKFQALDLACDENLLCPPYFRVTVPQRAWESYYGHGTEQIAGDIAWRVRWKVRETSGYDMKTDPVVELAPSADPDCCKAVVEARFFRDAGVDAEAGTEAAAGAEAETGQAEPGID